PAARRRRPQGRRTSMKRVVVWLAVALLSLATPQRPVEAKAPARAEAIRQTSAKLARAAEPRRDGHPVHRDSSARGRVQRDSPDRGGGLALPRRGLGFEPAADLHPLSS